jgi:heptosyltransferase-2
MNRVALFLPNWIGDVVMATPAIRAVREAFPRAELVAVCKPYVADVLAGAPWFARTVFADKRGPRDRRLLAVARELRRRPLDAALLFPNSFRTALLAYLGGAKRLVGFARYGRSALLTDKLYARTDNGGRFVPSPALDDYNRLARALGTHDPGHRMELFTTPADEAAADAVWERFGLHRYARVVALNPGAAEREMARRIAEESRSPHVTALSDSPLSLGLTRAVVRRADLLVTTDSGPRHFAAAFDRPVVSLFGPTHIGWTETYFAREICLQKRLSCGPCQQRVCPLGHHRCMRELTPAEVFDAATRLLERAPLRIVSEVPRAA